MAQLSDASQRVAPYVVSGAVGAHVLQRMRKLSQRPATDASLYSFVLRNSDVLLALGGAAVVIWHVAKLKAQQRPAASTGGALVRKNTQFLTEIVHDLREVFTALLIGLGLINKKVENDNIEAIPDIVQRLSQVVRNGIRATNRLDDSSAGGNVQK